MKRIALSLIAVVFAGMACADDAALKDMELRLQSGVVNVIRDGETINVDGTLELEPGDVIVSKEGALAEFALEGGAGVRQGQIQEHVKLLVRSSDSIEAQEGNVLMNVSDSTSVIVDGVTASTSGGSFRIDRGFGSVRAATYDGSLQLDSPGQTDIRLPRLYQATIVAGALPNQTRPYQLDVKDPWDRDLLEEVVDLEENLAALSRGFTGQVGRDRPGLDYFSALADGGDLGFMRRYLKRKPSDLLIGFTIAQNADKALRPAFEKAFELFDAGARWGIAAAILEVEPRPIVAELKDLILGTGVAAGSGDKASFDVAAAAAGEAGEGDTPTTTNNTDPGGTDPTDPGDDPKDPSDPKDPGGDPKDPKEPDECSDGAECAVQELEDELFPDEEPSPSPTNEQKRLLGGGGG